MTGDNGSENSCHKRIPVSFFFCHPYHSWEKGTVENRIGRIRQYIPKGTSLRDVTDTQIQWVENTINNTPMKVLEFRTHNEALEEEVNKHKFRRYKKLKEASVAFPPRM